MEAENSHTLFGLRSGPEERGARTLNEVMGGGARERRNPRLPLMA
jgi:hypothetical protein